MNNFSSFLDAPGSNMPPRQAPTPSVQHQNGMSPAMQGQQQNGSMPLVNGLPSGGQQTDMNHLWSVVQQLSQVLEENRAQTTGIMNGVQAIQSRAAEDGGLPNLGVREVNGELNGESVTYTTFFTPLTPHLS